MFLPHLYLIYDKGTEEYQEHSPVQYGWMHTDLNHRWHGRSSVRTEV